MKIYILLIAFWTMAGTLSASEFKFSNTAGPTGAVVNDIYYDGKALYAASGYYTLGGIYKSNDMGKSWELTLSKFNDNNDYFSITGMNGTIYAGTSNAGVVKSEDNGVSWQAFSNGMLDENGNAISGQIKGLMTFEDFIIAHSRGGIYILSPGSNEWEYRPVQLMGGVLDLIVHKGKLFAAMNTMGIYFSDDLGISWEKSDNGIPSENRAIRSIYSDGSTLLAGNLRSLHYSTDDGISWHTADIEQTGSGPDHITSDDDYFYCTLSQKVYRSENMGKNWQRVGDSANLSSPNVIKSIDGKLYIGDGLNGVAVSEDMGKNWELITEGLNNITVMDVCSAGGSIMAAVSVGDFGYPWISSDMGDSWMGVPNGFDAIGVHALSWKDGVWFAGTNGAGVQKTTDNGENWEKSGTGNITSGYISDVAVTKNYVFAATEGFSQGTFRSSDLGMTWESVDESLPKANVADFLVKDNTIYASVLNLYGVYKSTNEGDSWERIFDSSPTSTFVNAIEKDGDYIYLGTNIKGLIRSSDMGMSWEAPGNEFSGKTINDLLVADNYLFAAIKDDGVYYSNDKGISWMEIPGLPFEENVLKMAYDDEYLYAATMRYGVWKMPLPMSNSVVQNPFRNLDIILYPLPANDKLYLSVQSGIQDLRSISIIDINGITVKTFGVDSGDIKTLDISDMETGIYFLRALGADGLLENRKFVISR